MLNLSTPLSLISTINEGSVISAENKITNDHSFQCSASSTVNSQRFWNTIQIPKQQDQQPTVEICLSPERLMSQTALSTVSDLTNETPAMIALSPTSTSTTKIGDTEVQCIVTVSRSKYQLFHKTEKQRHIVRKNEVAEADAYNLTYRIGSIIRDFYSKNHLPQFTSWNQVTAAVNNIIPVKGNRVSSRCIVEELASRKTNEDPPVQGRRSELPEEVFKSLCSLFSP